MTVGATCYGCFSPFALPVNLRVGLLLDVDYTARIDLCPACSVRLYRPWVRRKS